MSECDTVCVQIDCICKKLMLLGHLGLIDSKNKFSIHVVHSASSYTYWKKYSQQTHKHARTYSKKQNINTYMNWCECTKKLSVQFFFVDQSQKTVEFLVAVIVYIVFSLSLSR